MKTYRLLKSLLPLIVIAVLAVAKIAGVTPIAQLSWWWITAPIWLPIAVVVAVVTVLVLFSIVMNYFDDGVDR